MAELNQLVIESEDRNAQILSDTITCVQNGRTPLVMTKYKEHARLLYQRLQGSADHVFLLQGGKSSKERAQVRDALLAVSETDTLIVVAIGKYIGEGFNVSRKTTGCAKKCVKTEHHCGSPGQAAWEWPDRTCCT